MSNREGEFGNRLKTLRRRAEMSQEELADRAGINRSYLSMIENGHSSPTMDVVQKLAQGLGVSLWTLISEVEGRHFTYDTDDEFEMYPGLRELLESEEDILLMNPSVEEIELLKGLRFKGNYQPSKRFFIEALLDYRRSLKSHS